MKHLHLILMLCLLSFTHGVQAQDQADGEQLLVFRSTGVVDLLYTHEVDSIVTNDTTQVFYAKDTVLVVPIAELDSVAVGSRNVMELNGQVRVLTEERDIQWLIRVEENHLYYQLNTPEHILPKVGDKLFFGESCELLPYGLAAKVSSVTARNGEQDVAVQSVGLEDIFDQLFYTGRVQMNQKDGVNPSRHRAPGDLFKPFTLPEDLDFSGYGEMKVKGETTFSGDFVVDVRHHYYHAHIKADSEIGLEFSLKSRESAEIEFESPRLTFPLPTIAWVIYPKISLSLYTSTKAELAFNYGMKRKFQFEFDWTRRDGEQTCEFVTPRGDEPGHADDEAKIDLTLNGELFLGARAILDLNLPGDRVGFRADMKFGPCFEGRLGMGMLSQLRNYDPQLFVESSLSGCLKLGTKASAVTHEHFLIFGDEVETPIYEHDFKFLNRTLDLFPQYRHTYAMASPPSNTQPIDVSMASAVEEPTPTELETGFEIVDPKGTIVDSLFVGTIVSEQEESAKVQTFDTEMTLPTSIKREQLEGYTMRPIFHYAGYTVSAAPVDVRKDVLMQPYTSTQSNGAMTFISSGPFIGSAKKDSTLYQVGMYLPVPLKDNVYRQDEAVAVSQMIDDYHASLLIGTWQGKIGDEDVTLVFEEDNTGKYNEQPFDYLINEPQSGTLLLRFENNENKLFRVLSLSENELKLMDKRDKSRVVLVFTKIQ